MPARLKPIVSDVGHLSELEKQERADFIASIKKDYGIKKRSSLLLLELAGDLYIRTRAIMKQEQQTGKYYLSARTEPTNLLINVLTAIESTPHSSKVKQTSNEDDRALDLFMSLSKEPVKSNASATDGGGYHVDI